MSEAAFCKTGKFRFATFAAANKQAKESRRRDRTRKEHRQPYRCQACGDYHVGSSMGHEKKAMDKKLKVIGVEE